MVTKWVAVARKSFAPKHFRTLFRLNRLLGSHSDILLSPVHLSVQLLAHSQFGGDPGSDLRANGRP
eukprot:11411362-Karenia_brevis.AAC.1